MAGESYSEARPSRPPKVYSVRDNGDGTSTVRDGVGNVETMATDEAMVLLGKGDAAKLGKGLSDCAWCRYGKPAVAGAVAGLGLSYVAGYEPTRGLVWGAVGGLLYGQLRG